MAYNPFGSFRNVFDRAEGAGSKKRFLSSMFPFRQQPQQPSTLPTFPRQVQLPQFEPMEDERSEGESYFDEMEKIRTRRGPALSAYQQHLKDIPTRETAKPSIGRRIGAGLIGAAAGLQGGVGAGLQTSMGLTEAPYTRAVEDWSNRAKGLGESARLEREEVEGQLKALSEARALGLDYDEYELKKLQTMSKIGLDERAQSTRERIADLTQQRDRATDERERTRIQGLIDYQQGQLRIGGRRATSEERRAATGERAQKSLENYRIARLEQLAKSSGASPNELGKAMENALNLLARDPAFADFIDSDVYPPVVKDPRGWFSGPAQEQYRAFNRELRKQIEAQIREGKLLTGDEGEDSEDFEDFEIGVPEF